MPATPHDESHVELLRFSTCGSVDDGKSTLIGRVLFDSKQLFDDQLEQIEHANLIGGDFNLANITDGLRAEREQGITIDVAYRYFATPNRRFIVADTPGHVQYTRNMVTGASTANLAVILIDARKGVIEQTRRHSYIASLLGIPHMVICINKMDLVDYSEEVYRQIHDDFEDLSTRLEVKDICFIPVSALLGDNVVEPSTNMPWFDGPPLLSYLENVHIANDRNLVDARLPVQYVIRPHSDEHHDFRGFAGQVASGVFKRGDPVIALPSGKRSCIKSIHLHQRELQAAYAPVSVAVTLEDEIDLSRGDMLAPEKELPYVAKDLEAMVCWMHDTPMRVGKKYLLKHCTTTTRAVVKELEYRIDISNIEEDHEATGLGLNEIGKIHLRTQNYVMYDNYRRNRATGAIILVDEATHATVAAGMIREPEKPPPSLMLYEDYVI